jgi:hypothetical protein
MGFGSVIGFTEQSYIVTTRKAKISLLQAMEAHKVARG